MDLSLYFIFTFLFVCFVPIVATLSPFLSHSHGGRCRWRRSTVEPTAVGQCVPHLYYASRTQRHIEFSHRPKNKCSSNKDISIVRLSGFSIVFGRHTVELIISNADLELWEFEKHCRLPVTYDCAVIQTQNPFRFPYFIVHSHQSRWIWSMVAFIKNWN